ncbi:MAG TPA: methyltransferase domain-containing protein [Phycisphaerae bacterium]|jgi:SAM-dependent methyltransferase|nr:methyltransferase domain-containing protein [Phycisphaerae bacterium]HOB72906.1 methyltransferase domain-containing protein [Phycisphaerae bacterium]HOJ53045.1 methyltransferase domain-containing protein [Phycisphaerae bacterium]HOL24782.1 methyltransferase domain-containing protein [Phycisphaerae bacterium]HPP19318.1 methyltransferase domain-containing protein [Phycisphaerae bacterium]
MTSGQINEAAGQHLARRRVWESKYAIRACYRGWFERLRPFIAPGRSLEIGAGSGHFKTLWPELIESDVVTTPYVDLVADGMRLPIAAESLGNLLVVDLLHHLRDPHLFFDEAVRVLRPGGRVLAIEPYITPLSWLGYRLRHHEDIYFGGYHRCAAKDDPWAGNLALPNLLFAREAADWPARHPELRIIHRQCFSLFDFQLAGGFKPYAFISNARLYDWVLAVDRRLDWIAALAGFRIFCVIERVGGSGR